MKDEEYPEYLSDKYAILANSSLDLPRFLDKHYTEVFSTDLTLNIICRQIDSLVNDYPAFFLRLVDDWIRIEQDNERAKMLEDSKYGTTFPSRSRLQKGLHPRIRFEHLAKKALSDAKIAMHDLSEDMTKWYLYTEDGQRKAQRECEVRHVEVESDTDSEEELWRRECPPSPSPAQRPLTPKSTPTSPSKRSSDADESTKTPKRHRTDITPSPVPSAAQSRCATSDIFGSASSRARSVAQMSVSPLPTFPDFDFSQRPMSASPLFTPKPSLVVPDRPNDTFYVTTPTTPRELDSQRVGSNDIMEINDIYEDDDWQSVGSIPDEPVIPTRLVASDLEVDNAPVENELSAPDDGRWRPLPGRPDSERTVLVLPVNPNQVVFWSRDVKFHVQWELEMRMAQQSAVQWQDLHLSDLAILEGTVAEALPKIDLVMQAGALRAEFRDQDSRGDRPAPAQVRAREPQVSKLLHGQPGMTSSSTRRMCTEADREEASIRAQDGKGSYSDDLDWKYGGKLIYTVYVRPTKGPLAAECGTPVRLYSPSTITTNSPTALAFSMELRPPTMTGKSFHLARKYGSRRILNFKFADINDPQARKEMFDLFEGRRFVLAGRVFRAWSAATDKSSLVAIEINESIPGITHPTTKERHDPVMPTFLEQLASSNDLSLKPSQAMAKWASRPQLLLSDSYPAVCLLPSDVHVIDDIVVAGLSEAPTTEQTLTDGCGLMTEAVARQIGLRLPSSHGRPCVVQMRLMGAKGLLVLMSPDQEILYSGKQVILRKSMVKSLTSTRTASQYIIEVVRCGHNVLKTSAALPSEAIIALNSRKVPRRTLIEKAELAFDDLRTQFDPTPSGTETSSDVRQRLSAGFYRTGGVGVERKKRMCRDKALSLRVCGLIRDEQDKPILDNGDQDDEEDMSGQPVQLAERAMMVVDAGFDPRISAYACNHLHRHVDQQTLGLTRDFRIPISQSMSAFIVPDSLGVLGPDEIYVAFSGEGPIDPVTGCPLSHLAGPVLAFRSPCKLPTDVQRYTAVYRPELRHLKDCIVMSASATQCRQSPASFLAGGDYDGDTATIIFDQTLVQPFVQADDHIAKIPSGFEEENFEKELVKGDHFLEKLRGAGDEAMIRNYQTYLLGAILDDKITGLYSVMHDNAVYKYGHGESRTIRLARMFSVVLDARKSGLQVKPNVLQDDRRKFQGKLAWRAHKKGDIDDSEGLLYRHKGLEKFIMDELWYANSKKAKGIMRTFPKEVADPIREDHDHLAALYIAKRKQVLGYGDGTSIFRDQLEILTSHVTACFDIWAQVKVDMMSKRHSIKELYCLRMEGRDLPGGSRANQSPVKRGTARPETLAKAANMRELARVWHTSLRLEEVSWICTDMEEVKRLMVSCAAVKARWIPKQVFPFDMDFPTTLQLKAEKVGQSSTMTLEAMMAKKPTWRAE